MAVAAVLADGLKIGLQSIEVLGVVLCGLDVGGEFGDCRLKVVHSLPDRRSRGCLSAGFRAIRKQRGHLLGVFGKGRVNFLYLGDVERPLALDHCRADLRLFTALFHQSLALMDELWTALRRGRGYAEQKNGKNDNQFTKHAAASDLIISLVVPNPMSSLPIQHRVCSVIPPYMKRQSLANDARQYAATPPGAAGRAAYGTEARARQPNARSRKRPAGKQSRTRALRSFRQTPRGPPPGANPPPRQS